jgi:hypothetical protein
MEHLGFGTALLVMVMLSCFAMLGMLAMEKDVFPIMSLDAATRTADANGTGIDLQGYNGALVLGIIGAEGVTLSGTDKIELELEESDDDVTYTDVADADLVGYVDGTNDGCFGLFDANAEAPAVVKASYVGKKRYIRAVINYSGTHGTGTPAAVCVVRGHARHTSGDPV